MTIYLSSITFENDFASIGLADGSTLLLNKIDEALKSKEDVITVKRINIEKTSYDDNGEEVKTLCTSVIGLADDNIEIKTDFTQYLGQILNDENMTYCTLEV